jgi:hypothetical protein
MSASAQKVPSIEITKARADADNLMTLDDARECVALAIVRCRQKYDQMKSVVEGMGYDHPLAASAHSWARTWARINKYFVRSKKLDKCLLEAVTVMVGNTCSQQNKAEETLNIMREIISFVITEREEEKAKSKADLSELGRASSIFTTSVVEDDGFLSAGGSTDEDGNDLSYENELSPRDSMDIETGIFCAASPTVELLRRVKSRSTV